MTQMGFKLGGLVIGTLRNRVVRPGARLVVSAMVWELLYLSIVRDCRELEGFG